MPVPVPVVGDFPVVVCGDFNSHGNDSVSHYLTKGEIGPDFEGGGPNRSGAPLTKKTKKHVFGSLVDAYKTAYEEHKMASPPTYLAKLLVPKMVDAGNQPTPQLRAALERMFHKLAVSSPGGSVMSKEEVDNLLVTTNKQLGRGSEFRFVQEVFKQKGKEELTLDEFCALYVGECREGKYWGVEHDMALFGCTVQAPWTKPFETVFDFVYYTPRSLELVAVRKPISDEGAKKVYAGDTLPNSWHPSDHLPLAAVFRFK